MCDYHRQLWNWHGIWGKESCSDVSLSELKLAAIWMYFYKLFFDIMVFLDANKDINWPMQLLRWLYVSTKISRYKLSQNAKGLSLFLKTRHCKIYQVISSSHCLPINAYFCSCRLTYPGHSPELDKAELTANSFTQRMWAEEQITRHPVSGARHQPATGQWTLTSLETRKLIQV